MPNVTGSQLAQVVAGICRSQAAIIKALCAGNPQLENTIKTAIRDAAKPIQPSLADLPVLALNYQVQPDRKAGVESFLTEEFEKLLK